MGEIGSYIITVTSFQDFLFVPDGQLKDATGNIGPLGVGMLMDRAYGSCLELYFYEHQVSVISHNLTLYTWFGIFP